ncbi:hypothetical protein MBGDN05_00289, partial [Thermoplasmatales archaeon SCGC AB-539-N05]
MYTVNIWVNNIPSGSTYVVCQHDASYSSDFILGYQNGGFWGDSAYVDGGNTINDAVNWHQLGFTIETGSPCTSKLYIDGSYIGTAAGPTPDALGQSIKLMARGDGAGNYVSGKADEFRVSNIIRNDSWIAAEYATIKNQTTFISIGSEEGGGWQVWDNATQNPDTSSPWTWEFDFPNETCYYEFYSIAYDKSDNQENAPSTADAICYYRGNTAPTVDYKTPINGTTGVSPCPSVTCEAYVNDSDGDSLTITWATNSSGSWTNVNTTTTSANSTVSYNFSQFSN